LKKEQVTPESIAILDAEPKFLLEPRRQDWGSGFPHAASQSGVMSVGTAPLSDPSPRAFHRSVFEEVSHTKKRIFLWISEALVILATNIAHISHC